MAAEREVEENAGAAKSDAAELLVADGQEGGGKMLQPLKFVLQQFVELGNDDDRSSLAKRTVISSFIGVSFAVIEEVLLDYNN
jgi:hypothetical protein